VCGEGLKYADGTPVSASVAKDKFNNIEFGAMGGTSVGINLHRMIADTFGYRGEFQITESLIMCDMVRASETDLEEAYLCGVEAVKLANKGESGYMVSIERMSDEPYMIRFGKAPLKEVAVSAKPMPAEYFNEAGNFVSQEFIEYMQPLAGDIPEFIRLEKKMVKRK
jgi:6-phosphofructokinase 1